MTDDLVRQLAAAIRWRHPLDHFATLAHTLTGLGDISERRRTPRPTLRTSPASSAASRASA